MRNTVCLRVVTMGLGLGVFSAGAFAQTLLVANQGDSTMSILDVKTGTQVATVGEETPGVHGHEIAVGPDGRTAFMPIYGSSSVGKPGIDGHEILLIDVPSGKIVGHIELGHGARPHLPILDPVSGMLYVTTEMDKAVTVIDPKTKKVVGMVPTGQEQSHMLAISHDGKRGYTANVGPGTVSVLDLPGRKTITVIPLGETVHRISISNDDKLVFTADQVKPRLAVIDTTTNKLKTWIPLPAVGFGTGATKDGRSLLVSIPSKAQVMVLDLASMKLVRTIDVLPTPQEVLIRPDGRVAYVSCDKSGKIAVIDLDTWTVTKFIDAGKRADGMAWMSSQGKSTRLAPY